MSRRKATLPELAHFGEGRTIDPLAGDFQVPKGASRIVVVNPDANGHKVKMPDATEQELGGIHHLVVNMNSTFSVDVADFDGTVIETLPADNAAYMSLADKSTAAGIWTFHGPRPVVLGAQYEDTSGT